MDQTYSLYCPRNENHLGFKVADGQDHILCCPKNENHLGFKVADGPDRSLSCQIFYLIVAVVLVVNPGGMGWLAI